MRRTKLCKLTSIARTDCDRPQRIMPLGVPWLIGGKKKELQSTDRPAGFAAAPNTDSLVAFCKTRQAESTSWRKMLTPQTPLPVPPYRGVTGVCTSEVIYCKKCNRVFTSADTVCTKQNVKNSILSKFINADLCLHSDVTEKTSTRVKILGFSLP